MGERSMQADPPMIVHQHAAHHHLHHPRYWKCTERNSDNIMLEI